MRCPNCGSEMNHHANKLVIAPLEMPDEGGDVIIEAFSCPHCGLNAAKEAVGEAF